MQYKFRGKSTLTNTWVYGSLLQREDSFGTISLIEVQHKFPHEPEQVHVISETVGMWTGLKDKNGKEIYAGDILKRTQRIDGNFIERVIERYEVTYNPLIAGFEYKPIDGKEYKQYTIRPFGGEEIEVISNIHDHPHLLNPAQGAVINTMNNANLNDPGTQQAEATTDQVAAVEQEAQEKAMESAEVGTTEG